MYIKHTLTIIVIKYLTTIGLGWDCRFWVRPFSLENFATWNPCTSLRCVVGRLAMRVLVAATRRRPLRWVNKLPDRSKHTDALKASHGVCAVKSSARVSLVRCCFKCCDNCGYISREENQQLVYRIDACEFWQSARVGFYARSLPRDLRNVRTLIYVRNFLRMISLSLSSLLFCYTGLIAIKVTCNRIYARCAGLFPSSYSFSRSLSLSIFLLRLRYAEPRSQGKMYHSLTSIRCRRAWAMFDVENLAKPDAAQ